MNLIAASVLILLAVLTVLSLLRLARSPRLIVRDVGDAEEQIKPVDLDAFLNLISSEQEDYLRKHLSVDSFRKLQRERARVVLKYVDRASENASILLRLGQATQRDPDPAVARQASELTDCAIQLRMDALRAKCRIYLVILLPGLPLSSPGFSQRYEHLLHTFSALGAQLQIPGRTTEVHAVL